MEMMPQAIPNIVSSVRRFCAQSVTKVSRSRSRKDTVRSLLQNHLLLFVEAGQNLSLYAVGNSQLDVDLPLAVWSLRVGNFDLCLAVFVVNHCRFRRH